MKILLEIMSIVFGLPFIFFVVYYLIHKREIDNISDDLIEKENANRKKKYIISPKKRYTGLPWMPYI
jgi:hypothetical protein